MTPPLSGLIVDLLGFLTGTVLYVMLVAMVWRERAGEGTPFLSRGGRLPLLTGLCGTVWNIGALVSFGSQVAGVNNPEPFVVAIAFSALGFLPAVVVHSLLEGRETATGRRFIRPVIAAAYGLSGVAAMLHAVSAAQGGVVPSRSALWLLTGGFTALTASLLLVTRDQPLGRRGIWVAALSVFAVSAVHFGRHVGNESWWVGLVGHHASLLLALAILLQDYRFALADLFLKNAIALLLFMGMSVAVFAGAMEPLARWRDSSGGWDPRAVAIFLALWMATALTFPLLRRLAAFLVDRAMLRRPDYQETLALLAGSLQSADTEERVIAEMDAAIVAAIGASDVRAVADPLPANDGRLVLSGAELRVWCLEPNCIGLLRLRTVEPPHAALTFGPLSGGRRLLSDDLHLLEAVARLAAHRIDGLRVAQERLARDVREQQMQRLASEAELRALRAQLNPHFLFNALTTIGYLIQHAPPRALETLMRLTKVLRGVLRRSTSEFSTLGEEIDLIESYLDIERARYEERLRVTVEVADEIRGIVIPTLLLQPLVENAIKHGIAPRKAGGAVRLVADVSAGRLHMRVEDTGVGLDSTSPPKFGVGLASVAQRLQAHYGDLASLDLHALSGGGTAVRIEMPVDSHQANVPAERRRIG